MLLQPSFDWIDFISKIIGSFIATLFTILVWFILEYLKKRKEKKRIDKKVNELYEVFLSKGKDIHIANRIISLLIYEIGIEKVYKIFKLSTKPIERGYSFEGGLYNLRVTSGAPLNRVYIFIARGGQPSFDFDKPSENLPVYDEFINDFERNCEESKIKLKKKEKN